MAPAEAPLSLCSLSLCCCRASLITGVGTSELSIATNSWQRSTARAPPVSFPSVIPAVDKPWYPNILEIAEAAGVDVALFHDWAPLDRVLSPGFISRAVTTEFCADPAVAAKYSARSWQGSTSLGCWDATDASAAAGAARAVAEGSDEGKQLVWLHQAFVDEVGHSFGE